MAKESRNKILARLEAIDARDRSIADSASGHAVIHSGNHAEAETAARVPAVFPVPAVQFHRAFRVGHLSCSCYPAVLAHICGLGCFADQPGACVWRVI